jgi:hypothetical protein
MDPAMIHIRMSISPLDDLICLTLHGQYRDADQCLEFAALATRAEYHGVITL